MWAGPGRDLGSGHLPPPWPARAEAAGDDLRLDLGAAEARLDAAEPQTPQPRRKAAHWCPRRSRRVPSGQREPRRSPGAIWAAITRQGIVSPRRNSPSRGVAPTTTPNQRPRMSQPSMRTSSPVSSSRQTCHRSSRCTMPATAARCGRAPASRRAAIRISAGVRTLTTTAWARAALDDHRGGRSEASHAMAAASARHWRATASERRKCRISRLKCRA